MIYVMIIATIAISTGMIYLGRVFLWPWYVDYARLKEEKANFAIDRAVRVEETKIKAYEAETRRFETFKIKSGFGEYARETLVFPGEAMYPAPLGNVPRESIASTYSPRYQVSNTPAPAMITNSTKQTPMIHINNPPFSRALFDTIPFNNMQTLLGIRADNGNYDIVSIPKTSHKLVVGRSGMGKSTFSLSDLTCAMYRNDGDRLRVVILDPEGLTAPFKPYCLKYANSKDEIINTLKWLNAQVSATVKNMIEKKISLNALPSYTLVYLEESVAFVELMNPAEKRVYLELLCAFAVTARKAGYYLHMASQRPAADNKQLAAVRDQFNLRIAGASKKSFLIDALEFDDDEILEQVCTERQAGQFVREIAGKNVIIKAPYLDIDRLDEIIPDLLRHREPREITSSSNNYEEPTRAFNRSSLQLMRFNDETEEDVIPNVLVNEILTEDQESKEEAARRLWTEGYNSARKLADELSRLGYTGCTSHDTIAKLINKLGLRTSDKSTANY